jgi:hypothetical protein
MIPHAGIGRGVAAWCPTDRTLIDVDDLVDIAESFDGTVLAGDEASLTVEFLMHGLVENVVD